ncbi:MAG: ankyrin repeat domain-containing protein [Rhodocyclaceae bacterium]|jgi:hypothetical protein|nr:ankyrin repeat domain-containing protein [Rhodocyclaceae bacterium]
MLDFFPVVRRFAATALLFCVAPSFAGVYDEILFAADQGDTATVTALLGRGLDVNTSDRDGTTLLMMAARTGNQQLLEILLRNRANILKKNKYGDDALMLAAYRGDLENVKKLVAAGADVHPAGWTPLLYAAFQGKAAVVRYLLENGAQVDAPAPNGQTALMLATLGNYVDVVDVLMAAGADMAIVDLQGQSAAEVAHRAGNNRLADHIAGAAKARAVAN